MNFYHVDAVFDLIIQHMLSHLLFSLSFDFFFTLLLVSFFSVSFHDLEMRKVQLLSD